ncbi:MAG: aminoacyl-histidine dipeptidase [Candidatus Thorarchaeota archaeon]|nr:MAG: aminoacyl-histidine dipeptidase [Candidatus Thorarchaeota archaeon]
MVLESLEPKVVWEIFEHVFSVTPRESKKEDKIRAKLKSWIPERAKSLGIDITITEDDIGNILVKRPASPGMESVPSLLFQGHMDMVCETDRPDGFDSDNLPIPVRIQDNGEWVDADGTTLGADNAIGTSIALAVLLNPNLTPGPLELLITVDEETGLTGAFALDTEKLVIDSRLLVNIDSGDLGVITIGSAGGGDTTLEKTLQFNDVSDEVTFYELTVAGLFGGHSGVDIHKHRANANKLVGRLLLPIVDEMNIHLCKWNGGSKHNAITREATAKFAVETGNSSRTEELLVITRGEIISYFKELEPDIQITWEKSSAEHAISLEESKKVIQSINLIHQGPVAFSPAIAGLVETSNNVAVVETTEPKMRVLTSTRSSVDAELAEFRRKLAMIGQLTGWDVILKPSYPGWQPEPGSPFIKFISSHYEKFADKPLEIKAIHAGLECGIIGSKIPGMKMVAIGPTALNAHTPDEKVKIATVGAVYNLLVSVVKDLRNLQL